MICGHGTAAQKDFGFQVIGSDLAENGIGALLIDYRGSGDSENIIGKPKGYISPSAQIEDFISAVTFARQQDKIDSSKIGLFGESMAATLTMMAAKKLEETGNPVQCVYAQSPACFELPKWPLAFTRFILFNAIKDLITRNNFIKAYQEHPREYTCYLPDSFCFWPVIPDEPLGGWGNRVSARSILNVIALILSGRVKRKLKDIKTPTLISQGSLDRFLGSSYEAIHALYQKYPNDAVQIYTYDGEHMSAIPMVNPNSYERDKVQYQHPSNTYYPSVYEHVFPVYLKFFQDIFRLNSHP